MRDMTSFVFTPTPRRFLGRFAFRLRAVIQTDCDRAFPVKEKSFDAFDYVVVAFLNIGYFYRKQPVRDGCRDAEFYTLPREWIIKNHKIAQSGWEKVHTKNQPLDEFKNEAGFELIATALDIQYPQ